MPWQKVNWLRQDKNRTSQKCLLSYKPCTCLRWLDNLLICRLACCFLSAQNTADELCIDLPCLQEILSYLVNEKLCLIVFI
uniref:Uncharacterized protein n=1 Tax=Rhizophora mucronata TaxID=61149 RepID=A0A2P2JQE7_RHIMU